MTRSFSADTLGKNKYRIPLLLTLITAGLAGNYFRFPIFLNIDFLFGSIFAMLALQFFGVGRGILAAAIIASYTYSLWNHPYAIIIMTAEVAFVGWIVARSKLKMVLADTLYWLFIGMPLAYLFYHLVMHVPLNSTYITMIKQAINGIANAIVARLIFTGYALNSRSIMASYREIVYNLLAFFVLCPALVILAVGSRINYYETDRFIRSTLLQDSRRVTDRVVTWVLNRKTAIICLAEVAATLSPHEMQPRLEQTRQSDLNFKLVALLNKEAMTTAYSPLIDELGQSTIGKSFADRPYISVLKRTLKPMLSEVAMSKVGIPKPLVRIIAPVVISGAYSGYVSGVLNLDQIRMHLDKSSDQNTALYTLLDDNGNVIMTNRSDQKVMTPFVRGKGTINHLDNGISQWVPIVPPNTSISERWKKSVYVAETAIGDLAEWKLILEQPVAPLQKALYANYTGKLTLLFLILLGSLALAEFLSRKIIVTLGQLRALTHEFPIRLAADCKDIVWPESGIQEANHLINNFREMADSLSEQFIETRQINESLELRVEERTQELLASEKFTIDVMDSLTSNIAVLDSNGIIIAVNEPWLRFARENRDPLINSIDVGKNYLSVCKVSIKGGDEDATAAFDGINAVLQGEMDGFFLEYPCHSPGEQRWYIMSVSRLSGSRHGVVVSHANITKRKQLESEIQDAREYAENIVETVREPLVVLNSDLKILTANLSFYDTFKVTPAETIGNFIYDIGNRQWDIPKLRVLIEEILPLDTVINGYEVEHVFPGIGHKIILLNARQIFREDIGSHIILLAMEDITEHTEAALKLIKSEKLYHSLVETSQDLIWQCDAEGRYIYLNLAWEQVFDYGLDEMLGKKFSFFQPPEIAARDLVEYKWLMEGNSVHSFETTHIGKFGNEIHLVFNAVFMSDEHGTITGTSGTAYNITQRKLLEIELRQAKAAAESATEIISRLARTDELTGLHNRRSFNVFFDLALNAARRHGHPLSVISIDLDHFKSVNDTLGHSVGDLVLQEFSSLIQEKIRVEDIAARMGGEEFIVLLSHTAIEAATALAERVRSNFEQNPSSASPLHMTASFGVAQLQDGEPGDALIKRADDALYRAKNEGRNRVVTVGMG